MTAQARTKRELEQLLAKKDVPEEVAHAVLERFEDVGLVDDEAFAAAWVASRQQRKHLSRRALAAELSRKGVERDVARAALVGVSAEDELAAAIDLARSRAPRLAGLDPTVQRRRLQGVLARRGFNSAIVMQACREALEDDDGDDALDPS